MGPGTMRADIGRRCTTPLAARRLERWRGSLIVVACTVACTLAGCKTAETPVRSLEATVGVNVPDPRASTPRIEAASAEVLIGQARSGGVFQSFGRVAVPASQFGQRVTVPVTLGCGTSTGCTVQARLRLLGTDGTPFDSADAGSFPLVGGQTAETGGFTLRTIRRLVPAETLAVAALNSTRQLTVNALDDADRPLLRRVLAWTVADPSIATVDSIGRVTALRSGRTTVTASAGSARANTAVVVNTVQSFSVSASATRVIATLTVRLTPQLTVGPGLSQRVRYRSSDTTVAVVADNGTVTTRRQGVVTITAIAEADTLEQRTVSVTVDPFRAALTYTGVSVLSRGDVGGNVFSLWGQRFDNLVGAGCGHLSRWNGSAWRLEQSVGYCANAVAGTAENNVVAVGTQVWRWSGSSWTRESYTPPAELFGAVAVDGAIYAVGVGGLAVRRTDAGWSPINAPTTRTLRSISGTLTNNIWAVGDGGVVLRFSGTAWQTMVEPDGQFIDCKAVLVRTASDVLASCNERGWGWSIQRFNGFTWTRMNTPQREYIADIETGGGRVWAVGSQRTIYRLEGDDWVQDTDRLGDVPLQALWADDRGVMAVGNEGYTTRRTASGWVTVSGYPLYDAMWAGGPDLIVAAGSRGTIDLFDGTRWINSRPQGEQSNIRALWGAGRDAIFAAGPFATMLFYDGRSWQPQSVPTTAWINGLWGVKRDSVWAVTSNGEILFYNGAQWSLAFRTGRQLWEIHGRDARNIVTVGDEGRVWRFDGRTWQREESGTDANFRSVYVGPTRTFAVSGSQIFENRNGEWRDPVTIAGNSFNWITGSGDADVYAGGCGAQTRRFDGTSWSAEVPTSLTQCTLSGAVVPGGGLVIGGVQRDIISGAGPNGVTPGRIP